MAYHPLTILKDNIAAIRIALDGQQPSLPELETLKNYHGFGGIKAILFPEGPVETWKELQASKTDLLLHGGIQELHSLLRSKLSQKEYEQSVQSLRNSVLTAFYTPAVVAQTLYRVLKDEAIHIKRLCEPSAGSGVFITEALKELPSLEQITAIEKEIISGRVLSAISKQFPVKTDTHIKGFEESGTFDNGKYDLIVSNIPFGNFPVFDRDYPDPALSGKIHNYFFVKGLDKIKEGGLLAFVTTDAFLNSPSNRGAREYLFNHSDFISLAVMPDNLMKETGNTEAPNHLLIVQKNSAKQDLSTDEHLLLETAQQSNEFGIYYQNRFVIANPQIIIGDQISGGTNQYGTAHQRVWQSGDINNISEKLSEVLSGDFSSRYSRQILKIVPPAQKQTLQLDLFAAFAEKTIPENVSTGLKPFYKEGTLVIHNSLAGTIHDLDREKDEARFVPFSLRNKPAAYYAGYIKARDAYFELALSEADAQKENQFLRKDLNRAYEAFTGTHGSLNELANRKYLMNDALGLVTLASLEIKQDDKFIKTDIFIGPLFKKEELFQTDDPVAALAHSLNEKGKVDIGFITEVLNQTPDLAIQSLQKHIYCNPVNSEWQTADQYLSGNVVMKLGQANEAVINEPENTFFKQSLEAIRNVQPEPIAFELLEFNLGERWIPANYYQRFASELFDIDTSVTYLPSIDSFKVKPRYNNTKITDEWAIMPKSGKPTYGNTLLEHALENTSPFYTYTVQGVDNKEVRLPDNEAVQLAQQKIDSVRGKFMVWLSEQSAEEKKFIEKLYNDTYNCYAPREYDGSHLKFPSLDRKALGIGDLYESQKNAAWRIIQNRGALIDHEVGLGKTLTMIVAAQEMKRLAILHKPMIIALKANVSQIAETYRKAYPRAKILFPGENDFTPAKRQRLFHSIKNNNWDCIILTHDQFGKIPQSPEIQKKIIEAELENLQKDLDTVKSLGGEVSRSLLRGMEIRRTNLTVNLQSILHKIDSKKDEDINFRELGIDHLFVDEAHKFKNLTYTTRHTRVAGLGNSTGSQKALNMLFAVRSLQEKMEADLCVTFLSGTPISNSLTEMYLLFKYLRPKEMERQRIENFDAWAAVYTRKTVDFEFTVTNEINAKERFRHFIKVPELALFYNEITDYKTAKHINLDKPELSEELINIKPTEEQKEFTKKLMAFAKSGNASLIGRQALSEEEDKGRMLIATNYAKKMAADMRLINPLAYDDDPGNKVSVCAAKTAHIYKYSSPHLGTQIIFSDIGTPKKDAFNLYDALKDKLVQEYNIPEGKIAFIHDYTDRTRPELFRKMNAGEIRILIGSTDKAGTGLNVQERVVAMHHLDIPWKPSELEQRNGRGARQGNKIAKEFYNNEVKNYIYAVEQTLDNYKFNLLKNKQTFISQLKNADLHTRSLDEGAMDEKTGMNFSEYIAILSGDNSLLEKSRLEKKIAALESLKHIHFRECGRSRRRLEETLSEQNSNTKILSQLTADEKKYKSLLLTDKDGTKQNPLILVGFTNPGPESAGQHIINLYLKWKPPQHPGEQKIGSIYGFDCFIRSQLNGYESDAARKYKYENSFYVSGGNGGLKYTYNGGQPSLENPKLAARHFLYALDRVSQLKINYEKEAARISTAIPVLKQLAEKPFEKESELQQLKLDIAAIEREIVVKIKENQLKEQALVIEMKPDLKAGDFEEKTEERKRKSLKI